MSERRFTRCEMDKVIREKNLYKEKYLELQEDLSTRYVEVQNEAPNEKSKFWNLFSGLFARKRTTSEVAQTPANLEDRKLKKIPDLNKAEEPVKNKLSRNKSTVMSRHFIQGWSLPHDVAQQSLLDMDFIQSIPAPIYCGPLGSLDNERKSLVRCCATADDEDPLMTTRYMTWEILVPDWLITSHSDPDLPGPDLPLDLAEKVCTCISVSESLNRDLTTLMTLRKSSTTYYRRNFPKASHCVALRHKASYCVPLLSFPLPQQPISTRYLGHVTGYQSIRDLYYKVGSTSGVSFLLFPAPPPSTLPLAHSIHSLQISFLFNLNLAPRHLKNPFLYPLAALSCIAAYRVSNTTNIKLISFPLPQQPISTRYLGHVTGYQSIRDLYYKVGSTSGVSFLLFPAPPPSTLPLAHSIHSLQISFLFNLNLAPRHRKNPFLYPLAALSCIAAYRVSNTTNMKLSPAPMKNR
eukprot:sb/3464454/